MKKLSALILTTIVLSLLFAVPVFSSTLSRSDFAIDETLSDQSSTQYAQPVNIWISHIKPVNYDVTFNSQYWYKLLYYYFITRLGYADIPFTYIIDREGNVIEGRKGGVGVIPEVWGDKGGITIGYLSSTSDYTPSAEQSLKSLVAQLSYRYGIKKDNVKVVEITAVKNPQKTTKSKFTDSTTDFASTTLAYLKSVTYSDIEHQNYNAEVVEIKYPQSVKAGERLTVEVAIKNKNEYPWFTDRDPFYITTTDFKDSPFAINGVWDSFSKPQSISKKTILPGEVLNLKFEMQALLLPGSKKASFQLTKFPKNIVVGSKFDLAFTITKGDFNLVQVKRTPSGYLNVRTCPNPSCDTIGRVVDNQVIVMIEKSVGWYKVKYSDTKSGWVYGPYIKEL